MTAPASCDFCSDARLDLLGTLLGLLRPHQLRSGPIEVAQSGGPPTGKTHSFGGIKFECEKENAPCRLEFPKPEKPDSLTLKIDQKIDPRCEQCKIDDKIPERGCNVFGGTCDPSGRFTARRPPPREQTVSEVLQGFIEAITGRGQGVAED